MQFLLDFLRKKAPKSGGEIPGYYRRALLVSKALLAFYFLLNLFLSYWGTRHWEPLAGLMCVAMVAGMFFVDRASLRLSLEAYAAVAFVWCSWYVHTYGWSCGDYTLRSLSDLFREKAGDQYTVCRWGGEEFCFFLPGKNLDEAGGIMMELCNEVRRVALSFETYEFKITITIGVEENDFISLLNDILEKADQKLYMGKNSGRDQVVV